MTTDTLRQRIEQLTARQQARLAALLAERTSPAQLVAYVVPDGEQPSAAALRSYLGERLPHYMVPSTILCLDELPRTPHGKVDREKLPSPMPSSAEKRLDFAAPCTPEQEVLARIWAEVLGLEHVGIHDHFFEIGGDSILSIHVVSRARKAGLSLSPDQLFDHPTVAALAEVAEKAGGGDAEQGGVTGEVALTPIQHWFFEQPLADPGHWNQALWLQAPTGLEVGQIEAAVRRVARRHDALRLRFTRESGGWRQFHAPREEAVALRRVDLSSFPKPERMAMQEAETAGALDRFDLATGPLLRGVIFERGDGEPPRLLLVAHHLVVDLVSWQILVDDLDAVVRLDSADAANDLPPKTTSFKRWAETLVAHARRGLSAEDQAYWMARPAVEVAVVPVDLDGTPTEASIQTCAATLTVEETQRLLHEVPEAYNTHTTDVLLTALVQTFAAWTGGAALRVGIEGHGREGMDEHLDLSSTVGWFTSYYPVILSLEGVQGPGEALKSTKEQLRRVPHRGIGYGLLRYLAPETEAVARLRREPAPSVLFNYGGRVVGRAGAFRSLGSPFIARGAQNQREYVLEIDAYVEDERLVVSWQYSRQVHRAATIERLVRLFAERLRALITHAVSQQAGGFTPSDFPAAGLSQEALDQFLDRLG